jgi:ParB-like chromosome segregation protein Spo0J
VSHKPHPLAEEFPLLAEAELQEFTDGVKHNGLIHPIVLYQNMILDGRNRETACEIAGVEPRYTTLDLEEIRQGKDLDPVGYVIAANLHRRHLEAGARAMIAAKLATATVGGDHSANSTNGVPVAQVAKQMNVSPTSVTVARAI